MALTGRSKSVVNMDEEALADKTFSIYIRLKYANQFGIVKCSTCNRTAPWQEMHCGHWQRRGKKSTRWAEPNASPQCPICNTSPDQTPIHLKHEQFLISVYGADKVAEIQFISNATIKRERWEVLEIARSYWNMAREIAREKALVLRNDSIELKMSFWQEASPGSGKP